MRPRHTAHATLVRVSTLALALLTAATPALASGGSQDHFAHAPTHAPASVRTGTAQSPPRRIVPNWLRRGAATARTARVRPARRLVTRRTLTAVGRAAAIVASGTAALVLGGAMMFVGGKAFVDHERADQHASNQYWAWRDKHDAAYDKTLESNPDYAAAHTAYRTFYNDHSTAWGNHDNDDSEARADLLRYSPELYGKLVAAETAADRASKAAAGPEPSSSAGAASPAEFLAPLGFGLATGGVALLRIPITPKQQQRRRDKVAARSAASATTP